MAETIRGHTMHTFFLLCGALTMCIHESSSAKTAPNVGSPTPISNCSSVAGQRPRGRGAITEASLLLHM
eukprot:2519832-Pyramimonas_sp.AAC.1